MNGRDGAAVEVRPATPADAAALAPLLEALGYPAAPASVAARLERMAAFGAAAAFVAVVDGAPVGLVTAHAFPSVHADPPAAWLTTLVVASGARRRGVASHLVRAAEAWASGRGAVRISVTSGAHRAGAHAFYEGLAYAATGRRFTKSLP